jgi:hypothetical protein
MFKITPKVLDQNNGVWCVTLISFDQYGWHFMVWDGYYWQFIPDPPYGFSLN